jgi:Dolichyl-phosphate-mannose-protein mannosyltransferase
MDVLGLAAVGLVGAEWLGLGWLAGVRWPGGDEAYATWALRLLFGASLTAAAMLLLALTSLGFGSPIAVLAVSALGAGAIRTIQRETHCRAAERQWHSGAAHRDAPSGAARGQTDSGAAQSDAQSGAARGQRHSGATDTDTRWKASHSQMQCKHERLSSRREQVGWLVLGLALLATALRAIYVPEAGWDAYSHWGLKALAYSQMGTIIDTHTVHEYYPPLVPLSEAFLYLQRGSASIDLGKDVWPLVGSAFILCLAAHLRRLLAQRWLAPYAALGVLLTSTQLLEDFSTGQADLALTAFLTLATLATVQWLRDGQRGWLIQVGVFAAAAALTKFEGLPRIGVLAAALAVEAVLLKRRDAWWPVVWLAIGGLVATTVWVAYELSHGIAPTGEHIGGLQPQWVAGIALALLAVFSGLRTGGGILVVLAVWIVAIRRSFKEPTRLLALVVIGHAAATLLAFLVSDTAPDIEVRTAATRLVEQFMPVALVASAVWLEAELIIRPGR